MCLSEHFRLKPEIIAFVSIHGKDKCVLFLFRTGKYLQIAVQYLSAERQPKTNISRGSQIEQCFHKS